MEQYSPEWWAARLGNVSASQMPAVMSDGRAGKPSATRKNYMMKLLCERLTGKVEDTYTSPAMERGTLLEPVARAAYEIRTGRDVDEVGFVYHPEIDQLGASPDGMVPAENGCIEIKNPNTAQHIAVIQSGTYDKKYHWQMMCQMACTGARWCDFVSFDDRLPEELQLHVYRLERSEEDIVKMEKATELFLEELNKLELEMINRMAA